MNQKLILAVLILQTHCLAWALEREPQKVALLVGVNNYQQRGFSNLKYAERDVEELSQLLEQLGFKVRVMTGGAAGQDRATRDNLDRALQSLVAKTTKDDIVLVSLCGHGVQFRAEGTSKEDAYFCPVDASLTNVASLLSISYLIDDLLASKGGRNLLLIDACRDAPVSTRGIQSKRVDLPENTAVFFACSEGQTSIESPKLGGGHGAFTYCILQALRGKAVREGEVSWSGLIESVERQMADAPEVRAVLDDAGPQDPIHAGHVTRAVLGRVKGMAKPPAGAQPDREAHPDLAALHKDSSKEPPKAKAISPEGSSMTPKVGGMRKQGKTSTKALAKPATRKSGSR